MFIHNDWKPSSYHDILAATAMFLAWWFPTLWMTDPGPAGTPHHLVDGFYRKNVPLLGAVVGWRFLKDLMKTPSGFGFTTGKKEICWRNNLPQQVSRDKNLRMAI